MNITLGDRALEQLRKLPENTQRKIIDKLKFFASTSDPLKFAHTIKGDKLGEYRFRIGSYRAVFNVKNDTAVILKIGHRKDIYR